MAETYGMGKHYTQRVTNVVAALAVLAAATTYISTEGSQALGVTEAQVERKLSQPTVLKNLRVYVSAMTVATGTASLVVRKNGVDTTLKVDLTSGSSTGWLEDTTHSVSCAAGDTISIKLVGATVGAFSFTTLCIDEVVG